MAGAMRKMAVYLGLVEDGQQYGEYAVDEDGYPTEDYDSVEHELEEP